MRSISVLCVKLTRNLKGGNSRKNKHSALLALLGHVREISSSEADVSIILSDSLTFYPLVSSMSSECQESWQSESGPQTVRHIFLDKRSSDVCLFIRIRINYKGRLFFDIIVKIYVFFLTRFVHHDSLYSTHSIIYYSFTNYHWLFLHSVVIKYSLGIRILLLSTLTNRSLLITC